MEDKVDNYYYKKIDNKIRNLKISKFETMARIGGYILSGSLMGPVFIENSNDIVTTIFTANVLLLSMASIRYCKYSKEIDYLEAKKKKIKKYKYNSLKRISNF